MAPVGRSELPMRDMYFFPKRDINAQIWTVYACWEIRRHEKKRVAFEDVKG